MASRKSARADQVAEPPDRGTEEVGVSPPAPAAQTVKEAGRGGALRARQPPLSASPLSGVTVVSSSSPSSASAGKRFASTLLFVLGMLITMHSWRRS